MINVAKSDCFSERWLWHQTEPVRLSRTGGVEVAKRLECVQLAGAVEGPGSVDVARVIRSSTVYHQKREQAPALQTLARRSAPLASSGAKRVECVQLAGAVEGSGSVNVPRVVHSWSTVYHQKREQAPALLRFATQP